MWWKQHTYFELLIVAWNRKIDFLPERDRALYFGTVVTINSADPHGRARERKEIRSFE